MRRRIRLLRAPYCIAVIPLLLETGGRGFVDRVLVVDTSESLQRARAERRDGVTAEAVDAVMRAQGDRETRRRAADDLVSNDGDLDALKRETEALHRRYLALASAADGALIRPYTSRVIDVHYGHAPRRPWRRGRKSRAGHHAQSTSHRVLCFVVVFFF